jgi:hypothetical protein
MRAGPPVLQGFDADWATYVLKLKEWLVRDLLRGPPFSDPPEVAQAFRWVAEDIVMFEESHLGFPDRVTFPLTREGSNRRKQQVAFLQLMTDYFEERCGLKLPYEVGVLCEIAFPGEEFDQDKVRAALRRRGRPKGSA